MSRQPTTARAAGDSGGVYGPGRRGEGSGRGTWELHGGLGRGRVCPRQGPALGTQTPRGKAAPLVVLRARERRGHGAAREQDTRLAYGNSACTQREDHEVNPTTEARSTRAAGSSGPLHVSGTPAAARGATRHVAAAQPPRRTRARWGDARGVRRTPRGAHPRAWATAPSRSGPRTARAAGRDPTGPWHQAAPRPPDHGGSAAAPRRRTDGACH